MEYRHKKTVAVGGGTQQRTWTVDTAALRLVSGNDWIEEFPDLVQKDLREMSQMFPDWILVGGSGDQPAPCSQCGEYVAPINGAFTCVSCNAVSGSRINKLIWTGPIPVPVHGTRRIESLLNEMETDCPFDTQNALLYVPVRVVYPSNWPNAEPQAYYPKQFFWDMDKNAPSMSHEKHMLDNMRMCLFDRWPRMTIKEVIENRIIPHAIAQVIIADGGIPQRWFNR